jgi:PAS domain S-box-containing protein
MRRVVRPWRHPRTRRARYGGALVLAAATLLLSALIERELHSPLLLLHVGAVAIAAILGGAGPARLAAGLLVLGSAVRLWPLSAADGTRLGIFLGVALLVAHTSGWSRARHRRLLALRRQSALRLRSRLAFQRAIARALDEGVYAVDEEGRLTYVNRAAEQMLGYRASELVGRQMKEALRCSHMDGGCGGDACRVLAVMSTGSAFQAADDLLTRKDGSRFPIRYSSAPIRRGGRTTGAVVAFQDVSAEARAAARERFLAAATEQLAGSIDFDETLARVARLALPYLGDWCMVVLLEDDGAPRRAIVETRDPALAPAAKELLERYPIDLEADHGAGRVLRTGQPELLSEVRDFAGKAGSTAGIRAALLERIGLRSFIAVPLAARGRLLGVMDFAIAADGRRFGPEDLAVAQELARRCALALDNARLHRKVQEAVRARDEMLAVVSHDLRSPLGAILASASVLERSAPAGPVGERVRRSAGIIARTSARMARLVGDLLDLAALDSGRLSIAPAPLRPGEVIEEAADAIRPLAAEAGVHVAVQPPGPSPLVHGDRARLEQVLVNVLSNAVKVSPRGGSVCVGYRRRGGHVVFSVADCGPGIAPEERARVFERYWRGGDAEYQGTGLGLAIARGIVEAHGGQIWAASRRGRGAIFRFSVPVAREVAPARAPLAGADAARHAT